MLYSAKISAVRISRQGNTRILVCQAVPPAYHKLPENVKGSTLVNGAAIPISRRNMAALKEALDKWGLHTGSEGMS